MRKTASGGKTPSTMSLSSRAVVRSWPNGFSMTTRRHGVGLGLGAGPERSSCSLTSGNDFGGIDR